MLPTGMTLQTKANQQIKSARMPAEGPYKIFQVFMNGTAVKIQCGAVHECINLCQLRPR